MITKKTAVNRKKGKSGQRAQRQKQINEALAQEDLRAGSFGQQDVNNFFNDFVPLLQKWINNFNTHYGRSINKNIWDTRMKRHFRLSASAGKQYGEKVFEAKENPENKLARMINEWLEWMSVKVDSVSNEQSKLEHTGPLLFIEDGGQLQLNDKKEPFDVYAEIKTDDQLITKGSSKLTTQDFTISYKRPNQNTQTIRIIVVPSMSFVKFLTKDLNADSKSSSKNLTPREEVFLSLGKKGVHWATIQEGKTISSNSCTAKAIEDGIENKAMQALHSIVIRVTRKLNLPDGKLIRNKIDIPCPKGAVAQVQQFGGTSYDEKTSSFIPTKVKKTYKNIIEEMKKILVTGIVTGDNSDSQIFHRVNVIGEPNYLHAVSLNNSGIKLSPKMELIQFMQAENKFVKGTESHENIKKARDKLLFEIHPDKTINRSDYDKESATNKFIDFNNLWERYVETVTNHAKRKLKTKRNKALETSKDDELDEPDEHDEHDEHDEDGDRKQEQPVAYIGERKITFTTRSSSKRNGNVPKRSRDKKDVDDKDVDDKEVDDDFYNVILQFTFHTSEHGDDDVIVSDDDDREARKSRAISLLMKKVTCYLPLLKGYDVTSSIVISIGEFEQLFKSYTNLKCKSGVNKSQIMMIQDESMDDDDEDYKEDMKVSSYKTGDKVLVKMSSWKMYEKGEILRENKDGTYDIKFDNIPSSLEELGFIFRNEFKEKMERLKDDIDELKNSQKEKQRTSEVKDMFGSGNEESDEEGDKGDKGGEEDYYSDGDFDFM